jgi:transposase
MNLEERLNDPPPPDPLPIPRYNHLFTEQERQSMGQDLLLDLADEIILIRSRMQFLFKAAMQAPSPARLIHILDLYSRAAVRLGRLMQHRQTLHKQRLTDMEAIVRREFDEQEAQEQAKKQLLQLAAIRSSKKPGLDLIIENPLTLSPLQRRWVRPLLYPAETGLPAPGRPSVDLYAVLEGILHKLLTGIPWYYLPLNYPPYTTCHRYYRVWLHNRRLDGLLLALCLFLYPGERRELDSVIDLFPGLDLSKAPFDDKHSEP